MDVRTTLSDAERAEEERLTRAVASARRSAKDLPPALDALESFYVDLRRSNPAYAALRRPEPATVDRIRRELVDDRTAFVEYLLGEKRSIAWVVTRLGVQAAVLPRRSDLEALASGERAMLAAPRSALTGASDAAPAQAREQELYRRLVAPLSPALRGVTRLIVVADGSLAYLPFEVFRRTASEFLVEQYAVTYAQSASASLTLLASGGRDRAPRALMALGDSLPDTTAPQPGAAALPSLPGSRDEIVRISALFRPGDRVVALGAEATETTVKQADLARFRYLHFAVHGIVDDEVPARSGLVLSRDPAGREDGVLRVGEISRLHLDADVVTLSACRTGVGKLLAGEGLMSLSRAFFYAGARHVVATLWDVADESTAQVMVDFYAKMQQGLEPDEALRQAKIKMLKGVSAVWRHPHFWAPFVALQ